MEPRFEQGCKDIIDTVVVVRVYDDGLLTASQHAVLLDNTWLAVRSSGVPTTNSSIH
jgi:hypothetical protein